MNGLGYTDSINNFGATFKRNYPELTFISKSDTFLGGYGFVRTNERQLTCMIQNTERNTNV